MTQKVSYSKRKKDKLFKSWLNTQKVQESVLKQIKWRRVQSPSYYSGAAVKE